MLLIGVEKTFVHSSHGPITCYCDSFHMASGKKKEEKKEEEEEEGEGKKKRDRK